MKCGRSETKLRKSWLEKAERQIAELTVMQDKLMNLYVLGKGISEEQFVTKSSAIEREIADLQAVSAQQGNIDVDIDGVIGFAQSMLVDLSGCWNRLDPQRKPEFLRAMAPNGVTCANGVIGTIDSPWFVTGFSESSH